MAKMSLNVLEMFSKRGYFHAKVFALNTPSPTTQARFNVQLFRDFDYLLLKESGCLILFCQDKFKAFLVFFSLTEKQNKNKEKKKTWKTFILTR